MINSMTKVGMTLPPQSQGFANKENIVNRRATDHIAKLIIAGKTDENHSGMIPSEKKIGPAFNKEGNCFREISSKAINSLQNTVDANAIDFSSLHQRWLPEFMEDLQALPLFDLCDKINQRRSEIKLIKEKHKQKTNLSHFEMAKEKTVKTFLTHGQLVPVTDGKSGVYRLHSPQGDAKFIIKPVDEEAFTLNNPKNLALPFADSDRLARAKEGIPLYSSVQNAMLGYLIAKETGLDQITPDCNAFILKSNNFADITDRFGENAPELFEFVGKPDNEKFCLVQDYLSGYEELGAVILAATRYEEDMIKTEDFANTQKILRECMPDNINQEMFEEIAVLSWLIGEKDGNAGNFLLSKEIDPNSGYKKIYKIDCAASFPENNLNLKSGLEWAVHNYEKPLSNRIKSLIQKIDSAKIAAIMTAWEKESDAIEAMKERVTSIKQYASNIYEEWDLSDIEIFLFNDLEELHNRN